MFTITGTAEQVTVVESAISACDFPWRWLSNGLRRDTGREAIPVEWTDLSRYAAALAAQRESGGHVHIHEDGDTADPIEVRSRVLGLAWYSGRISLERTMGDALGREVFISEVAHMVDFFYLSDLQRLAVYNALHHAHPDQQIGPDTRIEDGTDLGHGHGWFDVGGYYSFVGEAFMGGFIRAFTPYPVTIDFDHTADATAAALIRDALLDPAYFGGDTSAVFHDDHRRVQIDQTWRTRAEATKDGRRPCGVCRP